MAFNQQIPMMIAQQIKQYFNLQGADVPQSMPWTQVSVNNPSGQIYSAHQLMQQKMTEWLGPLGGIASQVLIGPGFTANGGATGLNRHLMPQNGGTYAAAYQQFARNSLAFASQAQQKIQRQNLNKQFYRQYYNLITPNGTAQGADRFVQNALYNPFQLAGAIRYFADPMQIQRTSAGMRTAVAATNNRDFRYRSFQFQNNRLRAQSMSKAVSAMSIEAAKRNFGDTGVPSYGGFSSGSVATLAGLMATSSDYLGNASGDQLNKRVEDFKSKVRQMSSALKDLRDVFGQDVSAMVGAVQSLTGMKIGGLSASTVSSISSRLADAMAYRPDLTAGDIAGLGAGAHTYLSRQGIGGLTALTVRAKGTDMAMLYEAGGASYGLTSQQYQNRVSNTVAGAHGSINNRNMSLAYSVAKNKRGDNYTIQQFMQQVQAKGGDPVQAAMSVAGVKDARELNAGYSYSGYTQAMRSQMSTRFATRELYQRDMIGTRLMLSGQFGQADTVIALQALNKADARTQQAFYSNGDVSAFSGRTAQVLRFMSARAPQAMSRGLMLTKQKLGQNFRVNQAKVRKAFQGLDNQGGNKYYQIARLLRQKPQNGVYSFRDKQIDKGVLQTFGFSRLGFKNFDTARAFISQLSDDSAASLLQQATTKGLDQQQQKLVSKYQQAKSPAQATKITQDMQLMLTFGTDSVKGILGDSEKRAALIKQLNTSKDKIQDIRNSTKYTQAQKKQMIAAIQVSDKQKAIIRHKVGDLKQLQKNKSTNSSQYQNKLAQITGTKDQKKQQKLLELLQAHGDKGYQSLIKDEATKQLFKGVSQEDWRRARQGIFKGTSQELTKDGILQIVQKIWQALQSIADKMGAQPTTKTGN